MIITSLKHYKVFAVVTRKPSLEVTPNILAQGIQKQSTRETSCTAVHTSIMPHWNQDTTIADHILPHDFLQLCFDFSTHIWHLPRLINQLTGSIAKFHSVLKNVTLTFEYDLVRVKINYHVKYLGQHTDMQYGTSYSSQIIINLNRTAVLKCQ